MKRHLFYFAFAILFVFLGCTQTSTEKNPKYVFMFIGDGMGLNQVQTTELYLSAIEGDHGSKELSFSNFPIQSYQTTYSADNLITCSAAAGTALASGYKTNNGVIGKDTSLTINYVSIADKAKKAGYKIGILSSVAIDHATPACYYAHQDSRNMYYEISLDLPKSGLDFFGGGGYHYPIGKDSAKANAYELTEQAGYTIADSKEEISALKNGDSKILAMNPELYPHGEYYWAIDKKEGSVSLAEMTKKAIEVLNNDKGFFMMVEGGKIDWACHAHDGAAMIHETLAFDEAVKEALTFYKNYPDETLIIVTADHETGGIVLGNNYPINLDILKHQKVSAQEFETLLLTLKRNNANATFDEVMKVVGNNFGLGNEISLSNTELEFLKGGYLNDFKTEKIIDSEKDYLAEKKGETLTERVIYLMSKKSGISWSTYYHSATPVPIKVLGKGQEKFKAGVDNTEIPKIIEELMEL